MLGDFNGDAAIRNENYDTIRQVGFYDTYLLAKEKDDGYTISGQIDGWRENEPIPQRRIAQIWTNRPLSVRSSQVIFNNKNWPVISYHFGIMVEFQ